MHGLARWTLLAAVALIISAVPGCLKRKEVITVHRNLSVDMVLDYEQEQDPKKPNVSGIHAKDAMPNADDGWDVTETEKRKDDKIEITLHATQSFPPDAPLPSSYAKPDDPDAELKLQFPTEVWTEDREDGRYYYFRRTYQPRRWAFVEYEQQLALDDDKKKLLEKPMDELTHVQRVELLKGQALAETLKPIALAKDALDISGIDVRPEIWLEARRDAINAVQKIDFDMFIELQDEIERAKDGTPEQQRAAEQRFESELEPLDRSISHFAQEFAARLDDANRAAFLDSYHRVKLDYDITDELGGHAFDIHVKLPGQVVAHNGDKVEDGAVVWEFDGSAFRDRSQELLAVSRVSLPNVDEQK